MYQDVPLGCRPGLAKGTTCGVRPANSGLGVLIQRSDMGGYVVTGTSPGRVRVFKPQGVFSHSAS